MAGRPRAAGRRRRPQPFVGRARAAGVGIGTRLLAAAVRAGLDRVPAVVLEGDPGYYGARGFVPAGAHGILPPSDRVPAAACQVVVGAGFDDEMAGRIVYPEVWWRHDVVGLRDPLLAEVERRFR